MKSYKKKMLVVFGASVALLGGSAYADVVVVNGVVTATGTHVTYTFDQADLGLFGPVSGVSISGDTLSFSPTSFGGTGFNVMVDSLLINVSVNQAYENYEFTRFDLSEDGRFAAGGTYDADATFKVQDDYNPNVNFETLVLDKVVDGTNWGIDGTVWTQAGWGDGGLFNSATLNLSNSLIAFGGASAWKDVVTISAQVTPVPEAETYAMLLVGLGLVGFMARRRSLSAI